MLTELYNDLSPYNSKDLQCKASALQLLPENASKIIRLEALSYCIACLPYDPSKPEITQHKFKSLINKHLSENSPIAMQEDPCENLMTESLSFIGGSYIVFPGIDENITAIMRSIAGALFFYQPPIANDSLLYKLKQIYAFILKISDKIAARLNLSRNMTSNSLPRGKICFPPSQSMDRLKKAVLFTESEISEILEEVHGKADIIDRFLTPKLLLDNYSIESSPLHEKLLSKYDTDIVVSLPGNLLSSLRHHLLSIIKDVDNFYWNSDIPIYICSIGERRHLYRYIENLLIPVWVIYNDDISDPESDWLYFLMVDMIAYWLWQFSEEINQLSIKNNSITTGSIKYLTLPHT